LADTDAAGPGAAAPPPATAPPAGVPQDGQNFAPSSNFVPQFAQNAIIILLCGFNTACKKCAAFMPAAGQNLLYNAFAPRGFAKRSLSPLAFFCYLRYTFLYDSY
jgi:hypothetical protein